MVTSQVCPGEVEQEPAKAGLTSRQSRRRSWEAQWMRKICLSAPWGVPGAAALG
jgi:hypothetical protein